MEVRSLGCALEEEVAILALSWLFPFWLQHKQPLPCDSTMVYGEAVGPDNKGKSP